MGVVTAELLDYKKVGSNKAGISDMCQLLWSDIGNLEVYRNAVGANLGKNNRNILQ